jgi:hypothetical protein
MPFAADALGDLLVGQAVEGQQDHPSPLSEGLGAGPGTHHGPQGILLTFREDHLGRAAGHGPFLPKRLWK